MGGIDSDQSHGNIPQWGIVDEVAQRQVGPQGLNRMQAAAMAKYLAEADMSHNALMSGQRTRQLMESQNDPATYQLAQQYASKYGMSADKALHLAMSQRLAANGQYLGLGASLPHAQAAMDGLNNYNGELAIMFGVPWQAANSGGAYNIGGHGVVSYAPNGDGTHNIGLGGGREMHNIDGINRYVFGGTMRQSDASSANIAALNTAVTGSPTGKVSTGQSNPGGTFKQASDEADQAIKDAQKNKTSGATGNVVRGI